MTHHLRGKAARGVTRGVTRGVAKGVTKGATKGATKGVAKGVTGGALVGAGVAVAAFTLWRRRGRDVPSTWAVTVNVPLGELSSNGRLAGPLGRLSERVELDLREAPGGRGTEIRTSAPGRRWPLRRELDEVKQELEAGQVLRLRPMPEARDGRQRRITEAMDRVLARGGRR